MNNERVWRVGKIFLGGGRKRGGLGVITADEVRETSCFSE